MKTKSLFVFLIIIGIMACGCASAQPENVHLKIPLQTPLKPSYGVLACSSMVLDYYGEHLSQDTLNIVTPHRPNFDGIFYIDMIAGLKKIGYYWKLETFGLDPQGFENGMQAIRFSIKQGRPVFVSTSSPPIGATLIVTGFNDVTKTLDLVLPILSGSKTGTINYGEFEKIWHDDNQSKVRGMLMTYPND